MNMSLEDFIKATGCSNPAAVRRILRESPYSNCVQKGEVVGNIQEIFNYVVYALRAEGLLMTQEDQERMMQEEARRQQLEIVRQQEEARRRQEEEKRIAALDAELAKITATSGNAIEGYRITHVAGFITGDEAISINSGFSGYQPEFIDLSETFASSIILARRNAMRKLKMAAQALDCNALICVDYESVTMPAHTLNVNGGISYSPYVLCITAKGTAVRVEPVRDEE